MPYATHINCNLFFMMKMVTSSDDKKGEFCILTIFHIVLNSTYGSSLIF